MKFLDEALVYIRSGAGGHGCVSFRREKFIEFGGPNGGDGGRGGSVYAEAVGNLNTLIDYRYNQHINAQNGESGRGANRTGASGNDAVMKVPLGTQIFDETGTHLLADMIHLGQRVLLLRGGNGGFGNNRFKGSINQAPRHANPGQPALEARICLKLKLIADAGLVGLPNAGKSTLLSVVSAARPKIADYPFTTLHPNLGTIATDDDAFVLADIPGLIEGAHTGYGLGDQFLRHIERCAILLHLIDATQEDPVKAYLTIQKELSAYGAGLEHKPQVVALNKKDTFFEDEFMPIYNQLRAIVPTHVPLFAISAITNDGLLPVLYALKQNINQARAQRLAEYAPSKDNVDDVPIKIFHPFADKGVVAPYISTPLSTTYMSDDSNFD